MILLNFKYKSANKFLVENKPLKTSWPELTFENLLQLFENTSIENEDSRIIANLQVLSSLTEEEISHLNSEHLNAIKPWLAFVDHVDSVLGYEVPKHFDDVNIGALPWKMLEEAKQIINSTGKENLMFAIPGIIKIYTGQDITKNKIPLSYPIAILFIKKLEEFFSKYSRLNDYKPTSEEVSSGVDKLSQYGFFTTLHALCKGNPLNYDNMLDQPADNIYQTLVLDFELSEYQKRFKKAIENKPKS